MKLRIFALSFLFVVMFSANVNASAVIIDASGDVKAALPGKSAAAVSVGMEFPNGTTIKVGAKGFASVLLDSGELDQIAGGSSYTVGGAGAQSGRRVPLSGGIAIAMRELSSKGDEPAVHGMVRETRQVSRDKFKKRASGPNPNLIGAKYPIETGVELGSEITFKWEKTPSLDWENPVIIIDDASKNRLAVIAVSKNTSELTVKTSRAKLAKGRKYSWYLGTSKPSVSGKTMRFEFWTISVADETKIQNEMSKINSLKLGPDGRALLKAQVYYGNGLYMKAVNELEPLYAKNRLPFAEKIINSSYSRMGQSYNAPK
jgi:hypothetical protein